MTEKEQKEETKEPEERYSLIEVPTQTAIAVKDNETEKIYHGEALLLEILNKINKIEKAVAW